MRLSYGKFWRQMSSIINGDGEGDEEGDGEGKEAGADDGDGNFWHLQNLKCQASEAALDEGSNSTGWAADGAWDGILRDLRGWGWGWTRN